MSVRKRHVVEKVAKIVTAKNVMGKPSEALTGMAKTIQGAGTDMAPKLPVPKPIADANKAAFTPPAVGAPVKPPTFTPIGTPKVPSIAGVRRPSVIGPAVPKASPPKIPENSTKLLPGLNRRVANG